MVWHFVVWIRKIADVLNLPRSNISVYPIREYLSEIGEQHSQYTMIAYKLSLRVNTTMYRYICVAWCVIYVRVAKLVFTLYELVRTIMVRNIWVWIYVQTHQFIYNLDGFMGEGSPPLKSRCPRILKILRGPVLEFSPFARRKYRLYFRKSMNSNFLEFFERSNKTIFISWNRHISTATKNYQNWTFEQNL